eukprot:10589-Heterococcus_DN1.PRE.1
MIQSRKRYHAGDLALLAAAAAASLQGRVRWRQGDAPQIFPFRSWALRSRVETGQQKHKSISCCSPIPKQHLQCMAHAAHEALSTNEAVPLHAGGPKLKVLVVTFNLGNAPPSEAELKDWLPVHEGYDVIAFGLQESTYNMRKRGRAAAA